MEERNGIRKCRNGRNGGDVLGVVVMHVKIEIDVQTNWTNGYQHLWLTLFDFRSLFTYMKTLYFLSCLLLATCNYTNTQRNKILKRPISNNYTSCQMLASSNNPTIPLKSLKIRIILIYKSATAKQTRTYQAKAYSEPVPIHQCKPSSTSHPPGFQEEPKQAKPQIPKIDFQPTSSPTTRMVFQSCNLILR